MIEDRLRLSGWSRERRVVLADMQILDAVGKAASHGGQTHLYLTPLHGKVQTIKALIVNIREALHHVKSIAEQLPGVDRWATLLHYICQRFAPKIINTEPQTALMGTG